MPKIQEATGLILQGRSRYSRIEDEIKVPWWAVGILHYRESTCNFKCHLHNGDPLTDQTYHEPPGRPTHPPANEREYTWEESALDALKLKDFHNIQDESLAAWLWRFNLWNGFGYAMRGINSEYLWSGSNHFGDPPHRGKFVADGRFDEGAESDQVGAGTLLWYFHHSGSLDGRTAPDFYQGVFTATEAPTRLIQLRDIITYFKPEVEQHSRALAHLQQGLEQQLPQLLEETATIWRSSASLPQQKSKPKTLAEKIVAYMERKGYKVFTKIECVNLVGLEGMNPDGTLNSDTPDQFNDSIGVIVFEGGQPKLAGLYLGTTEPGAYYTYNRMNSLGAARLQFGQYTAWQVGIHGHGGSAHEALVQTGGEIVVCRDGNEDFCRTGDKLDQGEFAVNIHWGFDLPREHIQRASAGCQTIRLRRDFSEFMALVKSDSEYQRNSKFVFTYTLIDASDIMKQFN